MAKLAVENGWEKMKLPTVSDIQSIKVSNDFTTLILADPIPFKKIVE